MVNKNKCNVHFFFELFSAHVSSCGSANEYHTSYQKYVVRELGRKKKKQLQPG